MHSKKKKNLTSRIAIAAKDISIICYLQKNIIIHELKSDVFKISNQKCMKE